MEKTEQFVRDFIEEFNKTLGETLTFEDLKPKEKKEMFEFAERMFKRGWDKK